MVIFLGILLAFLVFLIVVLVHEFGHFSTARMSGMKVEEFGFGIPPRVARIFTDKKGTEYTFNALPIGGFVRILGEDPTGADAHKKGAFMTKSWGWRVIVLVAGVTMNFVLAFLIFTGLFAVGVSPVAVNPLSDTPTGSFFLPSFDEAVTMGYVTHSGAVELTPMSGSIAEKAGILSGSVVVLANGVSPKSPETFIDIIKNNTSIDLTLEASGTLYNTTVAPDANHRIGSMVGYHGLSLDKSYQLRLSPFDAIKKGAYETWASTRLTLDFLGRLIHGIFTPATPIEHEQAKQMLSGPIGVGATFVGLVEISAPLSLIFIITALISINLGVVNLLPLPALDGGRIVTTTLYSIIVRYFRAGKDRFLVYEKYFHAIGFILFLLLTIYVAGVDISRFF